MKAAVTRQAVIQRINRALKKEGRILRKNRRFNDITLGDYFIVDIQSNSIARSGMDVDVEELAREIGVLAKYEKLED